MKIECRIQGTGGGKRGLHGLRAHPTVLGEDVGVAEAGVFLVGEVLDLVWGDRLGGAGLLCDDGAEGVGEGKGLIEGGVFEDLMDESGGEGITGTDGVFGLDFVAGVVIICP